MQRGKLKILNDGSVAFWCKGCNKLHQVYIDENKPIHWSFNGDYEKPTFNPSILITTKDKICHSFITNGNIQYLDDCYHELKGQTIEL